jgi:hypothetical protein
VPGLHLAGRAFEIDSNSYSAEAAMVDGHFWFLAAQSEQYSKTSIISMTSGFGAKIAKLLIL